MVLHPFAPEPAPAGASPVPAWQAVSGSQLRCRDAYWLITQPDHAALAGALAAQFWSPVFRKLEPEVIRAIGIHDAGWAMFDAENSASAPPPLNSAGKPLSFFEIAPHDFLRAWTASIKRAEEIAPIGGIIVSRHFCGLGQGRLNSRNDPTEITAMLRDFVEREARRQQRLAERDSRSESELQRLTATLQFCDLLSLYLCCGSRESVEFPQMFGPRPVRAMWRDGGCFLNPSPFSDGVSLGVVAHRYPAQGAIETTTLGFLVQ